MVDLDHAEGCADYLANECFDSLVVWADPVEGRYMEQIFVHY